jgi:hypothetical protein
VTEAAWNYRFKARIGKEAQLRQQELSEPVRTMAWKAQLRLTRADSQMPIKQWETAWRTRGFHMGHPQSRVQLPHAAATPR